MKPGKYFTLCFVLFLLWWEEHASGRPTTTVTLSQSITDSVTTKIMDNAQGKTWKTNAQENTEDKKFPDSKEMGLESEKMNSQLNQTIYSNQANEHDLKELANGTEELSDDSYYMLHDEFHYDYENYDDYKYDYNGHEENALHKTKHRNNHEGHEKSESQKDIGGREKVSKGPLKPRYKKNQESSSYIDPSRELFQKTFMVQKRNGETTEHNNLPLHHSVHHETDVDIGDGHVPDFNIDEPDAGSVDLHSGESHRFPEDLGPSHFDQSSDNPDENELFTTQSISSDIDENGREELHSLPDDLIHTHTNPSNLDHFIDILSGDHTNQHHFTTNIPLSTDTSTSSSADNINTNGLSNATSTGAGVVSANEVVSENVSNSSGHAARGQNVPVIIDQTGGHAVLFEDHTNEIDTFTNKPPNINQNGTQSNLNETVVNDHNTLSSLQSYEINPTQTITEAHTTFYGENTASSSIIDVSSSVHHSFGSSMSMDQSLQPSITYSTVQVSNTISENSQFQTSTLLTGNRASTETPTISYITESETSHIVTTPDYGTWIVTSLMAEGPSATINPSTTTTPISERQTSAVTDRETPISEPTMKPDEKENITNRPGTMAPENTTDNPTSVQSSITSQHFTNRNVSMYSLTSASGNYHTTDSTERSPLPPSSPRTSTTTTTTTPSSVPTTASLSSLRSETTTDTVTLSTAQTESRVVNPPSVTSAVPPEIFTVLTTLQSITTDRTVPDENTVTSLITEEVPNGTETKLPSTRHTPSNANGVTSPNIQTGVSTNPSGHTASTSLHQSTDHTVRLTSADGSEVRVSTFKPHIPNVPSSTSTSSTTSMPAETSEPPPSFVELTFAMSWPAFCNHAGSIKGELVEICRHEAGRAEITEDQIQLMNKLDQECSTVNVAETDEISDEITVRMYFTNKTHHYDQELTIVCAEILESSSNLVLRDRSIIRDKLLYVRYNDSRSRGPVTGASIGDDSRVEEVDPNSSSDDPGVTIAVSLAVLGGCCCVGLIALQVVIRKRNQQSVSLRPSLNRSFSVTSADSIQLSSVTKSRPNSGVFNPGLDLSDPMDPTHPLNYTQLANFCVNESKIEEEFQKIPNRMPRLSVVPAGEEDKNRYANILPLTHTRVKLLQEGPNPRSSYINASYVTGPDNQCQYYIATQAPVEETISDFWAMVWQQNSKAIVMLTQMEEGGQVKCASYWPELVGKSAAQKFGDFLIELKQKDVHQEYIAHKLEINNLRKIEKRQIDHFWYTCWPPHGVPEPISLVKLVLDTRPKYEDSGTPLIVHCSPGIGRSCTFIALDLCMCQFETRRIVDVMKTVHVMRQERAGAIQNKEQYQLLYQAISEYATIVISPAVSAASSATTLHALLPS